MFWLLLGWCAGRFRLGGVFGDVGVAAVVVRCRWPCLELFWWYSAAKDCLVELHHCGCRQLSLDLGLVIMIRVWQLNGFSASGTLYGIQSSVE